MKIMKYKSKIGYERVKLISNFINSIFFLFLRDRRFSKPKDRYRNRFYIIYPLYLIFLNSSFRLTAFNSFVKALKISAADESRKRSFLEEKYVINDRYK